MKSGEEQGDEHLEQLLEALGSLHPIFCLGEFVGAQRSTCVPSGSLVTGSVHSCQDFVSAVVPPQPSGAPRAPWCP